jgi:hypothetical protein
VCIIELQVIHLAEAGVERRGWLRLLIGIRQASAGQE